MNYRFLVILSLMALIHQASAQCGSNASQVGATCYCNAGFYGINDSSCQQCPSNTYSLQGTSNTGSSITKFSACSYCQLGYFVTTAGTSSVLPGCSQCPTASTTPNPLNSPGSISDCVCFDINGAALSSYNQDCQCNIGFYGTPQTTQGGQSGCIACPSGQSAPIGTINISGCKVQYSSILTVFQSIIIILILL